MLKLNGDHCFFFPGGKALAKCGAIWAFYFAFQANMLQRWKRVVRREGREFQSAPAYLKDYIPFWFSKWVFILKNYIHQNSGFLTCRPMSVDKWVEAYVHRHNWYREFYKHHPPKFLVLPFCSQRPPYPKPLSTTDPFSVLIFFCLFQDAVWMESCST